MKYVNVRNCIVSNIVKSINDTIKSATPKKGNFIRVTKSFKVGNELILNNTILEVKDVKNGNMIVETIDGESYTLPTNKIQFEVR